MRISRPGSIQVCSHHSKPSHIHICSTPTALEQKTLQPALLSSGQLSSSHCSKGGESPQPLKQRGRSVGTAPPVTLKAARDQRQSGSAYRLVCSAFFACHSLFLLPLLLTHCQRGQLRADRSPPPPSSHRLSAVRLSRIAIWTHRCRIIGQACQRLLDYFFSRLPPAVPVTTLDLSQASFFPRSLPDLVLPTPLRLQADVVCVTCIHPLRFRTSFLSSYNNFYRLFSSCLEEIEKEIAIDALNKPRLVRMSTSYPRMASTERSSRLTSAGTLGTMLSYGLATTRLVIAGPRFRRSDRSPY
jgi:hypothetical protein